MRTMSKMKLQIVIVSMESRREWEAGTGEQKVIESGFATFDQANARIAELGGEFYATYQGAPGRGIYTGLGGWQ